MVLYIQLIVGHRETGSPKKSFREFRSKFPSVGHSLSKWSIRDLSRGLIVAENNAFSMASICMSNHTYELCIVKIFSCYDFSHHIS